MKILIVDDTPRRYGKLIAALAEMVQRNNIDIVQCAMDARSSLSRTKYDLLICDILIPLRADEEPHERHSEELLVQLCETEDLIKPRRILGLTAFESSADLVRPFFKEQTWSVVHFDDASDDWINQIKNCVQFILKESDHVEAAHYITDIAVICALSEPELRAILKLEWNFASARPFDDINFVHEGYLNIGETKVTVVAASCSRMGMVPASLLTASVIRKFKPRLVVMVGICAGVRDKVALGDVILADPCWDWQSGKRVRDEEENVSFAIAPHQLPIDERLRSKFEQLRTDKKLFGDISDNWVSETATKLKLAIGPMATGSAVLADKDIMASIGEQHRGLCGVEMEIYGFYYAATVAMEPKPLFFALKSVCDFGNNKKDDNARDYAAYTCAATFAEFIRRHYLSLL